MCSEVFVEALMVGQVVRRVVGRVVDGRGARGFVITADSVSESLLRLVLSVVSD